LGLAGAINIAVSTTPPYTVAYQLRAAASMSVPLGVPIHFQANGVQGAITFLEGREIEAPGAAPKPPIANAAWEVHTGKAQQDPIQLGTLRKGMGLKPHDPLPDVAFLQEKLAIEDDGRFGPGTDLAVRAFQKHMGLVPDGVVGLKTWTALLAPVRA